MEVELTVNEERALNDLARCCELSPNQVIRQALRLYQLRHYMQGAGVDAVWRNRETGMIVESPLDEGGGCMGDDDGLDSQTGAGDQRDV